jgi:hypothetical protein
MLRGVSGNASTRMYYNAGNSNREIRDCSGYYERLVRKIYDAALLDTNIW